MKIYCGRCLTRMRLRPSLLRLWREVVVYKCPDCGKEVIVYIQDIKKEEK